MQVDWLNILGKVAELVLVPLIGSAVAYLIAWLKVKKQELLEKVKDLKQEYFTIRFQQATGQNQDANRKRVIRKDIARILTVVKERELAAK